MQTTKSQKCVPNTISLPRWLWEELTETAKDKGVSRSQHVRTLLIDSEATDGSLRRRMAEAYEDKVEQLEARIRELEAENEDLRANKEAREASEAETVQVSTPW